MVRLRDTQLHQPSSLCVLYKASLCLKRRVSRREASARLGLTHGRLQKGVFPDTETGHYISQIVSFFQGLWDILIHAPFSTPRNWADIIGVFITNLHFQYGRIYSSYVRLISAAQLLSDRRLFLFCIYTGFKHQMSQAKEGKGVPWKKGLRWMRNESECVPQENRFLRVRGEERLRRGQFTRIPQWVMNPHGFQPEHVIHLTS